MRRILPVLMLLCVLCLLPLTARAGSGEINGYAFVDKGGGVFDADGRMLSGVSVSLYRVGADGGETRVAQAATGADGFYAFTGLEAGQYRLRAVVPDNYLFTLPRTGGSVMLPACGTQSFSMPIDVAEGERVECPGRRGMTTHRRRAPLLDAPTTCDADADSSASRCRAPARPNT